MTRKDKFDLYYNMAFERINTNINQAYLCLNNAILYCDDAAVIGELHEAAKMLKEESPVKVSNTAIIIVSYNALYLQQKNIESIRNTLLSGTYMIYVVDNGSTDGVCEWLSEQRDVVLIKNDSNVGFAPACNQGVKAASESGIEYSDIYLLNNDTRLSEDSLFYLRMALYENEKVGAAGSVSNYAGNEQQLELFFNMPNEYVEYGNNINKPMENACEDRVRLSGFSMLIKKDVWNLVGGFDESFTPGYFEDDDLSVRISVAGYILKLCRNSFVYHAGSQSFSKYDGVNNLLKSHRLLFAQKHGYDIISVAKPRYNLISQIKYSHKDRFNVLVADGGIGADLKYIRHLYPLANVFALEKNEKQRNVFKLTESVFESVELMQKVLNRGAVFDVLILDPKNAAAFSAEEIDAIISVCKADCQVIQNVQKRVEIDFSKIKLIIWDMDDTFWSGTISEEKVSISPLMVQLIKDLSVRGIVNSISSKNDEDIVYEKLDGYGLREYFVFNHINWLPKGVQIKEKLKAMSLRAENVLFIDDNPRNLEEVSYENEGIMVSGPQIIPSIASWVNTSMVSDSTLSRLHSYARIEEKNQIKNTFENNIDFLRQSRIEVCIDFDCKGVIDRITELTSRTNQLNYTKRRDDSSALSQLIDDDNYECGYVRVRDRYGDYGIVGFFALDKVQNELRHFLFSCRIMGMSVESYVYAYLKFPEISVKEPVAVPLSKEKIDFIELTFPDRWDFYTEKGQNADMPRILLKGPCDLKALENYLDCGILENEFNYINSMGFMTTGQNHTMHIWNSAHLRSEDISQITKEVPFVTAGDFATDIFTKEYDVICLSMLSDCHAGLYKNKAQGFIIKFGSVNLPITNKENMQSYVDGTYDAGGFKFSKSILEKFAGEWEFEGAISDDMLLRNIDYIYNNVLGEPLLIILLGSEIPCVNETADYKDLNVIHSRVNKVLREYSKDKSRMVLINATDFVNGQEDYTDCINHLSRNAYFRIADKINTVVREYFK